jgi:hypothetical protein
LELWRDLRRHHCSGPIVSRSDFHLKEDTMRMLLTLLVIAYLVGVGVTLAPTIRANWSTVPASEFVEKIAAELPRALSWPVAAYRSVTENPDSHEKAGSAP